MAPQKADSLDHILKAAAKGAVVAPVLGTAKTPARVAKVQGQVLTALRWALEHEGAQGALVKCTAGEELLVGPDLAESLDAIVPTANGGDAALVAFVGRNPTSTDACRGAPLTGMEGHIFDEQYLKPLGLTRDEVLITNLLPMAGGAGMAPETAARFAGFAKAELQAWRPRMVIALGKAAREELGPLAHHTLPHPSVVKARGDSGELGRKVKKLRGAIDELRKGQVITAKIVKADEPLPEKRIVYGVALDGYQFDTQDDWCPVWEIEQTAHNWMAGERVIGFMHEQVAPCTAVESFLWPYPTSADWAAAMQNEPHRAYCDEFGSDMVRSGSWVVATRVNDPVLWNAVKAGEIAAYSIGGFGVRTPVDPDTALPQVTFIERKAPT